MLPFVSRNASEDKGIFVCSGRVGMHIKAGKTNKTENS